MAKFKFNIKSKKLFRWLWVLFILGLSSPFLLIWLVSIDVFGELPKTDRLEDPSAELATEVYSADGVLLGKFFHENRSPADFDHLSPHLVHALVSTEDSRYYKHSGIDFQSFPRVVVGVLTGNGASGGGSTVSQQLAKNLFGRPIVHGVKLLIQKLKEWVIAVRLERFYTKEEIIQMYLNTVDFGKGSYGIKSACRTFFNKAPDELSITEAAMLVGLLQAPTRYSPDLHPKAATTRRNVVLKQMEKAGHLKHIEYLAYSKEPILLEFRAESHTEGGATYFREYIRKLATKIAVENDLDLYTAGLKIYTTIDSRMQHYAEDAMRHHLKDMQVKLNNQYKTIKPWDNAPEIIDLSLKRSERYRALKEAGATDQRVRKVFATPVPMKVFTYDGPKTMTMSPMDSIKYYKYFLQSGFLALEPGTGYIKAWVGGVDFHFFKYDHVDPMARRQVGSTFKPLVYAAAIEDKYSPCMKYPNTPAAWPEFDNWKPKNSDGVYGGQMTLKDGLAQSVNCITSYVMREVGIQHVVKLAKRVGINTELPEVPSLCLGVADVSVYEMVAAFNTFNGKGLYAEPMGITKVVDKNAKVLKSYVPAPREALDEKHAYVMMDMMKGVTAFRGTAHRLRFMYGLDQPMAGKTGTTQNQSDAWFIGMVPKLTAGVWVGCDDRSVHFNDMNNGQGASLALPIYAYFMQQVYKDESINLGRDDWEKPKDELDIQLDCSQYQDQDHNADGSEFGIPKE